MSLIIIIKRKKNFKKKKFKEKNQKKRDHFIFADNILYNYIHYFNMFLINQRSNLLIS